MTLDELLARATSPWLDAEASAAYLGFAVRTFREKIATRPDFPEPRCFGGSALRWKRGDLEAWAEAQPRRRQPRSEATDSMSGR